MVLFSGGIILPCTVNMMLFLPFVSFQLSEKAFEKMIGKHDGWTDLAQADSLDLDDCEGSVGQM